MSEWYYSDAQRQQHGPIGTDELIALHRQGALLPAMLVWREGMPDWKPWREVKAEVIVDDPAVAVADTPTATTDNTSMDAGVGNDRFVFDNSADHSPYSPPKATVTSATATVTDGDIVYAGFLKRFAGYFVDHTVTMILSYAIIIPTFMMLGMGMIGTRGLENNPADTGALALVMVVTYGTLFIVPAIYYGWMQAASMQATLGKMATGIKIVRTDGSRIGFWRGFLRHLANTIFAMLSCGLAPLISAILVAATERHQTLHDMVCDTVVVDKHAFTREQHLQRRDLGTGTIVILVIAALLILGAIAVYGTLIAMAVSGKGLA